VGVGKVTFGPDLLASILESRVRRGRACDDNREEFNPDSKPWECTRIQTGLSNYIDVAESRVLRRGSFLQQWSHETVIRSEMVR
jgi:hypothetical protein